MTTLRIAPLGYEQITSLTAAAGLTVPTGAALAIIRASTAAVRWRDDGVAPTTSVGMPMATTDAPFEYSGNLSAIKFIAETGSPVLDVSYYRIAG